MSQVKLGEEDNLLVWGYACKLFRDDEKAQHVDAGKHLIPWMGDDKLMIDRYDGRGALYDLASYEAGAGNSWDDLSQEEAEIEKKCDKERYQALYEEEVYDKEEEEKRALAMSAKYGQIAYSYEQSEGEIGCKPPSPETRGRLYSVPPGLELPDDTPRPDTMKQHAIIVKTAAFIAQQGSQMEILMRLKQNGNRQFDFLTHGDPLHEYYKHLVSCIKSGTYTPSEQDTSCLDEEEPEEGDHYLHPSLLPTPAPPPKPLDPKKPPPIIKEIIDKMVKYISKNGLIFEEAIRKRNDPRFSFLDSSDIYYNYYRERVTTAFAIGGDSIIKPEELKEDSGKESGKKSKRKPTPVCFSIKKAKDNEGLEVPSALPLEDSSDDEDQENSDSLKEPDSSVSDTDVKSKSKSSKQSKDVDLQKERKMKVAQFLKGLKNK